MRPVYILVCISLFSSFRVTSQVSFNAPIPYGTDYANHSATGDFNGDGKIDIVTNGGLGLSVFLGNGDGTFPATPPIYLSSFGELLAHDFDGDGDLDIAIKGTNQVQIQKNNGAGVFSLHLDILHYPPPGLSQLIVPGYFNGDGSIDFVFLSDDGTSLYSNVFVGDGAGNFSATGTYMSPSSGGGLMGFWSTGTDLDRDGDTDVLVYGFSGVHILFCEGGGTVFPPFPFGTANCLSLVTADFNGDAYPDFALPSLSGNAVSIYVFRPLSHDLVLSDTRTVGNTPTAITAADFNSDGFTDVATANQDSETISILFGNGGGLLSEASNFPLGFTPFGSLLSGEFNGDGKPDLAVGNMAVSAIEVLTSRAATNSSPTALSLSASSVTENVAANTVVGSLATTDPDVGNTFTYTLVAGTGDGDNASFNISGSNLRITASPDYEAKTSYSIRVRTTDQGGLSLDKSFTINIIDINESPSDIGITGLSVDENVAIDTEVGTLSSSDPDAGNTFTYSLVAGVGDTDNASFNIAGTSLRVSLSPDYETKSTYNIRIRSTDQGGLTTEKTFAVNISDVNERPTFLGLYLASVKENIAVPATIGSFYTTDADTGNDFVYSFVAGAGDTDNASFYLNDEFLRILVSPDYETKNSYSIRVRTTDQDGLTLERVFTITITNINESPTNVTLSPSAVNENEAINTTVGTLSSTDPDAGGTFIYSLVAGTGDADNASFNINGTGLRLSVSPDYETKSTYSIRIRSTDQGGLTFEKAFTITINDVNEGSNHAPEDLALTGSPVDENVPVNTTAGTLETTDQDAGNTFAYALVTGAGDTDNASFNISGASLRISVSPDYEAKNSYSVRIRTTDQGGLTFEKSFVIGITNVNESPSNIAMSGLSVNENVAANTIVGSLATADPDAGNTFTYTLAAGAGDADNASFSISGADVHIMASPDYEVQNSYSIRIRTTDQGGLATEKSFVVAVGDLNEGINNAPLDITLSPSSVRENVPANTTVGNLNTSDADTGDTFNYSLVAGVGDTDNTSFDISGTSLRIVTSPDYEIKDSYSIRIRTTDQGGLTFEKNFTVAVLDDVEVVNGSGLFIPNLFSPNNDLMNDVFRIRGGDIINIRFRVFDSSGVELFNAATINEATVTGWNGAYNGKDMPAGTYFWTVDATLAGSTTFKKSGSVSLIR